MSQEHMVWVAMDLIIYKLLDWVSVHPYPNQKIVHLVAITLLVPVFMILWEPVQLEQYHKIQNWANSKLIRNILPKNVANHPLDDYFLVITDCQI